MNKRINSWVKPKKNTEIAEKLGKPALLFDMKAGHLYELNETGRLLWSLCDGKQTVDDMLRIMREQYDVSVVKITKDVYSFLKKLRGLNLIRLDED